MSGRYCLMKTAKAAKLEAAELMTGTRMRKYLATSTQVHIHVHIIYLARSLGMLALILVFLNEFLETNLFKICHTNFHQMVSI